VARLTARLPENQAGEFYVDDTCIDCETCWNVAPTIYRRSPRGLSYVHRQPSTAEDTHRALMALVACPTASIGTVHHLDARGAARAFPEPLAADVGYCGFAAESSFGASSYLIRRPAGNVLVDSPRAAAPLLARLDALGGVRLLFLTHRDDVADHDRLRRHFGCDRILHERDLTAGTTGVERRLVGDQPTALADDLLAIPVPGHTAGSTALLFRETFLFTGDHLWWSEERQALHASRSVCWYSWEEQVRSLERLRSFRFEWVLPGHGGRRHAGSPEAMRSEVDRLLARLR
jgi:glyoxylase-like metal-dependent hydrolase (beta-lactamase superfamily II)/ferredoxin